MPLIPILLFVQTFWKGDIFRPVMWSCNKQNNIHTSKFLCDSSMYDDVFLTICCYLMRSKCICHVLSNIFWNKVVIGNNFTNLKKDICFIFLIFTLSICCQKAYHLFVSMICLPCNKDCRRWNIGVTFPFEIFVIRCV